MKDQADSIIKYVEKCLQSESIQVNDYVKAIECLKSLGFGFKDVQMLLLKPKLNVLLNLVGLHYCLNILQVPVTFRVSCVFHAIFFLVCLFCLHCGISVLRLSQMWPKAKPVWQLLDNGFSIDFEFIFLYACFVYIVELVFLDGHKHGRKLNQ